MELQQEQQEQQHHAQYALSGACAGLLNGHIAVLVGGRELPFESFRATSRLDLFDLRANAWLESYDIDGTLASRIGHSVVTVGDDALVFGGERIDACTLDAAASADSYLNDVHALSFATSVLRCQELCVPGAAAQDGTMDSSASTVLTPCERAWHASTCVKYAAAATGADDRPKEDAMLVLGGRDTSGKLLSDVWLLVLEKPRDANRATPEDAAAKLATHGISTCGGGAVTPRWVQLTPTGTSPLPLAYHSAVSLDSDGGRVLVLGGKQSSAPNAPMLTDVFVLDLVTNTWSVLTLSAPSPTPTDATLAQTPVVPTARCCCTALLLVLPMEQPSGKVVLFSDEIVPEMAHETHEQLARDVVFIFGGFSKQLAAIPATTCVLLDAAASAMHELAIPNAGLASYMAHASVASADRKSLYLFGGIDPRTNALLDTTSALHFWRPQPLVDSLDDDDAANVNPIKTKRYDNGDMYVGELLLTGAATAQFGDALRHGQGKCTYASGDEYDGQWAHDQRCGQGTIVYNNGDMYVGQWERDRRHGYGIHRRQVAIDPATQLAHTKLRVEVTHDGHWRDDVKCGSGSTTFSDGSQLVATWHQDGSMDHGRIEHFDDGNGVCCYTGALAANGLPEGEGTSEHAASGETYTGHWHAGRRSGHGVATLRDGTTYTGEWRNGKRNGFGTCEYAQSRDMYHGKWVGGVRCGRGVCRYANGSTYDGEWQGDQCHGHGRFTFASGAAAAAGATAGSATGDDGRMFYEGSWRANRFCGDGALVLNAGSDDAPPEGL